MKCIRYVCLQLSSASYELDNCLLKSLFIATQIAEHGVASHWGYKLGNESQQISCEKDSAAFLLPSASCGKEEFLKEVALSPLSSIENASKTGNSYLDSLSRVRQKVVERSLYLFVTVTGLNEADKGGRSADEIGKLVALPASANTVEDAIVSMVDEYCGNGFVPNGIKNGSVVPEVWTNGRRARLNEQVENGDVLLVSL
jgi:hypothetical protein